MLFLDDPTLGLDPQTRKRIWDYIHHLRRREGITIFMTTHDMDEAEFLRSHRDHRRRPHRRPRHPA